MAKIQYPTPADRVIDLLGGPIATAKASGRSLMSVYRWTWPRKRGGTGGHVPAEAAQALLRYAKEKNLPLVAADFFEP
mgnify:CR=1 FL=1